MLCDDLGFRYFLYIGEPQYGPKSTLILLMGTPRKVPLIAVNPSLGVYIFCRDKDWAVRVSLGLLGTPASRLKS